MGPLRRYRNRADLPWANKLLQVYVGTLLATDHERSDQDIPVAMKIIRSQADRVCRQRFLKEVGSSCAIQTA